MFHYHFRVRIIVLFFLLIPSVAFAHGTEGSIGEGRGIMVQAVYDDGDTMSYTDTKVFHEPETMPFQTGRTDKNGHFIFNPDGPGTWRVEVEDEMGHAVILKTTISDPLEKGVVGTVQEPLPEERYTDKLCRIIAGLFVIFFIFGMFFWHTARKKYPR